MKTKIIIACLVLIFIVAVVINEINMRPKVNLVKDVEKIYEIVKNSEDYDEAMIIIDNGFDYKGKHYEFKGQGRIYVGKDPIVALERNGKCAMKLPYNEDVMFQESVCTYE